MNGSMARPILAIMTFAVGLVVVASIVSYSLVVPSNSVKNAFQSSGNNLIYSTRNDVILILNLVFYGPGNVTIYGISVKGDHYRHAADVGIRMAMGEKRKLVLHFGSDALSDFTENRLYDVEVSTSIGTYTVRAIFVGPAYRINTVAEWAQFMKDPTNSGNYGGISAKVSEVKAFKNREFNNGFYLSTPSIGYGYIWYGVDNEYYSELVRVDLDDLSYDVFPNMGTSYFSPVSGDGLVFSASFDTIYAVDPISGSVVWSRSFECSDYIETGALKGGKLFVPVAFSNGTTGIFALDPLSGEVLASVWVPGSVMTALTATNGRLAFGTYEGSIYVIDTISMEVLSSIEVSGKFLWDFAFPAAGSTLVAAVDGCGDTGLYIVDLDSGSLIEEIWVEGLLPTSNGVTVGGHYYLALHHHCGGPNKARILDLDLSTMSYEIRGVKLGGCGGVHYITGLAASGKYLYAVSSKCKAVLMRIDLSTWDTEYVKIKMKYAMPPVIYNAVYVVGGKGGCGNPWIVTEKVA